MSMADRIRERRTALGYTQEELAEKLGLQKSAVAKYEKGRVENIKRSIILKMASILECSPSYLFDFEPEYQKTDIKPIEKTAPHDIELLEAYNNAPEDIKSCICRILGIEKR